MSAEREASDQILNYTFKGGEAALRLSGFAAKELLILLKAVAEGRLRSSGAMWIKNLMRTGEPLMVIPLGKEKTPDFKRLAAETKIKYAMLYTQLFQTLYYLADKRYGGRLPVPVHFILDEFANIALPDAFDRLLATMRSRRISVSIIIQNMAQLRALYEKQWESIAGNCDEFLYLGGNEMGTFEYVSKQLGKGTIDTTSFGKTRGRQGSYSTNYQRTGRELLTPDEVRLLPNDQAILLVRGERPLIDRKYNLLRHPNIAETADGGGKPFLYAKELPKLRMDVYRPERYEMAAYGLNEKQTES